VSRPAPAMAVIVAVTAFSLLVGLVVALRGGGASTFSAGADSYSRSALGHRGLVNLLQELDIAVQRGRAVPTELLASDLVTLLCEPRPDLDPDTLRASARWGAFSDLATTLVLVLPRWEGRHHPRRPGWVADRRPLAPATLERVCALFELPARAFTAADAPTGWQLTDDLPPPVLDRPQLLEPLAAGDGELEPVWWCDQGVLLARWERGLAEEFYVLSDPGLLNNAGLGRGANARLVLALLAALGAPPGGVLIDETLHGHAVAPAPAAALLRPPLLWLTLHLLLLALVALWTANARLGRPHRRERAGRDGKAFLVASTASLLLIGGHRGHLLRRYLDHAVRTVARARHVPATGSVADVAARLDRLPGVGTPAPSVRCARLAARADHDLDTGGLLAAAREVHTWTREMRHGTRRPARDRRPAA